MTEREMRNIIGELLKKSLHKVIIPSTLGVGLVLAVGCSDDDNGTVTKYSAPAPDQGIFQDQGMNTLYGAPAPDQGIFQDQGMNTLYGAPAPDQGNSEDYAVVKYGTPLPDTGTVVKYQAQYPDAAKPEMAVLYAAPMPATATVY